MTSRIVSPAKTVGETLTLSFPFQSQMGVGVTISTKAVAATVYSGTDSSPSSVISGSAGSSGQTVTQLVTGGVAGVIYLLICTITTSDSQTLTMSTFLAVTSNAT